MTQGKIKRRQRSLKNNVTLQQHLAPSQLCQTMEDLVEYYTHQRYHESLNNMTPGLFWTRAAESV